MKHYQHIIITLLLLVFCSQMVSACDDTLIMLLTAKNPTSEFSKTIRTFMNSLTVLGTALKYTPKEDYNAEVNGVMDAWLEFSKKYMTNPPEEAKNDRQWRDKMGITAKSIGEIRKLVNEKKYLEAHNGVLELSNTIGTFFEAVGISDEKQVFVAASSDLNDLQRFVGNKENKEASDKLIKIRNDLDMLKKYITEEDYSTASNTAVLIESIEKAVADNQNPDDIDKLITNLRTSFEELRSRILMNEWFSEESKEGNE